MQLNWLRALTAPPEDVGWIPSTHVAVCNICISSVTQTYMQANIIHIK